MGKARLEAFSDGVIAIIITIMVLELRTPGDNGWHGLVEVLPEIGMYVLSFVIVGIYWNNHHHLCHATERVTARIMWANLHLLFWLSLIPFTTGWVGHSHLAAVPTAAYGMVLLSCAIAWVILQSAIIASQGRSGRLAAALGSDWKGKVSLALYVAAVLLAFVNGWIATAIYAGAAIMWLVPDRRIEATVGV
jgi:uncharacterized membrane protein